MSGQSYDSLKVLTYNIHKGVCFFTRKQVIEAIKKVIHEVNADLVFLQEVRGDSVEELQDIDGAGDFGSQLEFLADSVWPHFAYGKNAVYQGVIMATPFLVVFLFTSGVT